MYLFYKKKKFVINLLKLTKEKKINWYRDSVEGYYGFLHCKSVKFTVKFSSIIKSDESIISDSVITLGISYKSVNLNENINLSIDCFLGTDEFEIICEILALEFDSWNESLSTYYSKMDEISAMFDNSPNQRK